MKQDAKLTPQALAAKLPDNETFDEWGEEHTSYPIFPWGLGDGAFSFNGYGDMIDQGTSHVYPTDMNGKELRVFLGIPLEGDITDEHRAILKDYLKKVTDEFESSDAYLKFEKRMSR